MKTISMICAALVVGACVSACGGGSSYNSYPTPAPVTPTPPVVTPPVSMIDAFFAFVRTAAGTAPDESEPAAIEAAVATAPEDTEPAEL